NMYLETRDIDETMKIYSSAWEKGVKTTYYLHMKPRHTAEQSTTNVNKAVKIGKVGFGALNFANSPAFSAPLQKSIPIVEPIPTPTQFIPEPVSVTSSSVYKEEVISGDLAGEAMKVMSTEEPLVSTTNIYTENTKVEEVQVAPVKMEPVAVTVNRGFSSVTSNQGPQKIEHKVENSQNKTPDFSAFENPAEDEGNVCISCQ
ncbi:MAG TPA: hypothetical protein VGC58_02275, partial [Candidatus Paceibacterota bacterium]